MSRNIIETVLGAVVLLVAAGFLFWAYGRSDAGDPGGYTLRAKFERIDGLEVGGDVRISGIKVGRVLSERLDPQSFRAEVTFSVKKGIEVPADSSAAIVSSGLLGGKYLSLVPGGDERVLKDGEEVTLTQSAVNLEDLIGRYIFSQGQGAAAQQSGQGTPPGQGGATAAPAAPGGSPR
ncbi:outer membrane lipid asymmetry maintenance protein MlaD [Benzoatithermus flavus]|uniref:Outer membrane lipid asymmetry maintenance protein MlaD n=1 Tax=Benzoatithermus flavus TaxID=3108223 RepID=A0ABU8XUA3_9PROT